MISNRAVPTRVVEIATPGLTVSLNRGFLAISQLGKITNKIPLDDIGCVIVSAPGLNLTTNLLDELSKRNTTLVTVGRTYKPSSILFPLIGSGLIAERMQAQAAASLPLRKRLWAQIVRYKIKAQSAALVYTANSGTLRLRELARAVRSGDPTNCEAQAARVYWTALMGTNFRRNREQPGVNALLNYGYTLLRAAALRAIGAAGLHPMLGLHHMTRGDGMRLGDDLMEPFRPAIDLAVFDLVHTAQIANLSNEAKHKLVAVLHADYRISNGAVSPLSTCLVRLAQTICDVFQGIRRAPDFPSSLLPIMDEADNN